MLDLSVQAKAAAIGLGSMVVGIFLFTTWLAIDASSKPRSPSLGKVVGHITGTRCLIINVDATDYRDAQFIVCNGATVIPSPTRIEVD